MGNDIRFDKELLVIAPTPDSVIIHNSPFGETEWNAYVRYEETVGDEHPLLGVDGVTNVWSIDLLLLQELEGRKALVFDAVVPLSVEDLQVTAGRGVTSKVVKIVRDPYNQCTIYTDYRHWSGEIVNDIFPEPVKVPEEAICLIQNEDGQIGLVYMVKDGYVSLGVL